MNSLKKRQKKSVSHCLLCETGRGTNKDALIEKFIFELPILRMRIDMTQDGISKIIGVSRQTYSSVETKKRKMIWGLFMSLLFIFYYNPATRDSVERGNPSIIL